MDAVTSRLRDVSKTFDTGLLVCRNVSLAVGEGEFVSVIGPSGCGKTTLLRILCKLLEPSSGEVEWNRREPGRPFVGPVFQNLALLPWKTALQNVALGPAYRGVPRAERDQAARAAMRSFGLEGFEDLYPHQLSGGMQQRVALGRAFLSEPELLVMDEPFGALDAATRALMQQELLTLWEGRRQSVIFVTHSLEEAILIADRVVVLTARPASVKLDLPIRLPRPRSKETRKSAEFAELADLLWRALEEELRKTQREPPGGP
ncbi:MAG: ABC transporter ATP-binding protein [Elusimicrobia bacterium]|nr:ABC transporter ATP-binding protein [Elusimicrobiota bacterium]